MEVLTVQEMWYSRGGCEQLENRLEVLIDDGGAIEMLKIANTHGEVHLFFVHVASEAEVLLALGDGAEPEGVEGNVEDGGGVDIGDHHGMEGVVEEDDEEDEGHGGQGIGPPIHEDMECDNDGGHVSEDSYWLREVEFIESEIEVQSEGTRDKGESEGLGFKGHVRHRRRRQTSNLIESLEPNCTDDLQDLGVDDDDSEGTFVHDRGLSHTE